MARHGRHKRPAGRERNDMQPWEGVLPQEITPEGLARYQYSERQQQPPSSNAEPGGRYARTLGKDFIPVEPGRTIYQESERPKLRRLLKAYKRKHKKTPRAE